MSDEERIGEAGEVCEAGEVDEGDDTILEEPPGRSNRRLVVW